MVSKCVEGISTGYQELDELTNCFQPGCLTVLGSCTSVGKSALACNFSLAVAKAGHGVLIFDLEQPKEDLLHRILCIQGGLDGHKIRNRDRSPEEEQRLYIAADAIQNLPITIDDKAGRDVSQIEEISRRVHGETPLGLIVIDCLQMVENCELRLSDEQKLDEIVRRLKSLAKNLNVPVLVVTQLSYKIHDREDRRPRLSDTPEACDYSTDVVMLLHRPEFFCPDDRPGEADLIVAKNRSGPIGTVPLSWKPASFKFESKTREQQAF